jgi:hypothetical protein
VRRRRIWSRRDWRAWLDCRWWRWWAWYPQSKAHIGCGERGGRCQRGEKGQDEGSGVDVELHVEGLIEEDQLGRNVFGYGNQMDYCEDIRPAVKNGEVKVRCFEKPVLDD